VKRFWLAATGLAVALVATTALMPPARDARLPSVAEVRASWCPSDLRVLDRRGEVLHESRVDPNARRMAWAPLVNVSPALTSAILASEDRRFREHRGVDWRALAAAALQRAGGGTRRGASTITMQLAALLDPALRPQGGRRSITDKWAQMHAAWDLEEAWSKDEILEAYLNLVTFRGEVQGVEAAAGVIFGKAPHGLSGEEAAVLAASICAPNAAATALRSRAQRLVADAESSEPALLEQAVYRATGAPDARGPRTTLAPHAARLLLDEKTRCRDVASSLDARIQAVAVESLRRHLLDLEDRSARDGAVLVVDNASGEVLAYTGSSGDLSSAPNVDGVRAHRQAGSTLKPFLFASAIDRDLLTTATLLEDQPLEVAVGGNLYRPANYDNRFRGLVSVRTALASSLNIPAVRTLLLVGDEAFAGTLRALGFAGVTRPGSWYGPSLALGSADVSLWELVGAYRALALGGTWSPLRWRPGDAGGSRAVFTPASAFLVADVLADREGRATTFHLQNPLATRFWTAVKTGTSKDMRDNWCIGFSSRYTVGVWVGNFSGAPMHDVSGVTGAAPVWHDVMSALHEDTPSVAPPPPEDIVAAWTAFARDSEPARTEFYRRGTEPVAARGELDQGPRITTPADGSVFALDPDIAPPRQRVPLVAHAAGDGTVWRLDGRVIGSAARPLLWEPVRGRHELALLDETAQVLGQVRFEVKGPTRAGRVAGSR